MPARTGSGKKHQCNGYITFLCAAVLGLHYGVNEICFISLYHIIYSIIEKKQEYTDHKQASKVILWMYMFCLEIFKARQSKSQQQVTAQDGKPMTIDCFNNAR